MKNAEGIKKFSGVMRIHYLFLLREPEDIEGDWEYREKYDDWYNGRCAYPSKCCEIVKIYNP
jgi:hypothetical protein